MKVDLLGLDSSEIARWSESQGFDPYRGRQIRQWIYKKWVRSFDEMTNLPRSLRALLQVKASIQSLRILQSFTSRDGTKKYLFLLDDGSLIESVLIPERDHFTLCISSQAGCAMGCAFCLTGKDGLRRNLTAGEIIDQVIQVKGSMEEPDRLTNIVMMGMGEPLANYGPVLTAIRNLIGEDAMNFSHRKVTVSTCGLVCGMKKLGQDTTVNLAVSLNAADDETRSRLMPINRKYPLNSLLSACRDFPLPNRRMITFEYILISGVNDSDRDAFNLAKLLSGLRGKINLIPLNSHPGIDMSPPSEERILRFQEILVQNHFTAIVRKSKGRDIMAACGQLSGAYSSSR